MDNVTYRKHIYKEKVYC